MSLEQYQDIYKIVLLGDSGVGKTNIINNFVKGSTLTSTKGPTVGVEYSSKTIMVDSAHNVKAQIWDTTGDQKYRSLTTNQLKKALGALVVFDITNRKTFDSLAYWIAQLREKAVENVSIIVIGNKADKSSNRAISREETQTWARKMGLGYQETYVGDLNSLNKTFKQLAKMIADSKRSTQNEFQYDKNTPLKDKGSSPGNQGSNTSNKCC